MYKSSWNWTNIHTNFRSEWVLGFVMHYTWISKLLRDAVFTWRPRELSWWLKKWLIAGNLAIRTVHVLEKVLFLCFSVPRGINSRFCNETQCQMFLMVSGRHVGAHTDGHQHGVSIQISINLGKKFYSHISRKKNCCGESLHVYFLSFPRFWTLSIDRFWFLFWSILNCVTLKTSNWPKLLQYVLLWFQIPPLVIGLT